MYIFDEYLNDKDLDKRERAKLWRTSIGLQSVDNLRVSDFLIETARKHIEGKISIDEVSKMIDEHYAQKRKQPKQDWNWNTPLSYYYHMSVNLNFQITEKPQCIKNNTLKLSGWNSNAELEKCKKAIRNELFSTRKTKIRPTFITDLMLFNIE